MVRRKVEIKKIEDKAKRHTTFTKRRQGLFKKAKDLSDRSGDELAIIAFSLAGNVYAFGSPSVASVVHRYQNTTDLPSPHPLTAIMPAQTHPTDDTAEPEEIDDVAEPEEEEDLDELEATVEFMKKKVSALAKHMINKM